ncbi:hypothetical protein NP233_g4567 [Leucocoprinus birnbaumii]|uniref:RDRP core domain-containing protein n=1 Tax=Leucocoprinus birnbaumii TaxID=56174 RepID=A0AAD5VV21_9AGAR|nr:hypothetical protein NP233_g4567 [Leucocoprinus birnbaumii]
MRRLAAVFSSKRDKSDSHHQSDHSHPSSQPFKKHLKIPLNIGFSSPQLRTPSSITSTPQLSSVSDHGQSSGSSSGSASVSLPTPEDDSQPPSLARTSTRRSWKNWLGGKRSEPEPPPIPDHPKPPGWDRQMSAWEERPPTLQGPRRHAVHKDTDETGDETSEDYDDEESVSTSDHPRSPVNRPGFVASPQRARHNLEILIKNGISPPLSATPFVQHSADYLFPRSCNRPRPRPVFDMRRIMFKQRLLNRLHQLSADDEKAILPFALKASPVPVSTPSLPSHESIRPPKSSQILAASPGVRRWISRPCFEDRFSIFLPSQDGIRKTPVVGTLAVTAIEYSEFLDVMVDPDFDPSLPPPELSQEVQWAPSIPDSMSRQTPLSAPTGDIAMQSPSVNSRPSYLPSPSPLRNQHKSDVSLSDSTSQSTILAPASYMAPSPSSQKSKMNPRPESVPATQASVAAPVKRVVRFVEEDTEDKVPLHLVRQKKKQEEKAKFLRAEQRKRMMEQEQERRRLEAEAIEQERRRVLKEKERKDMEQRRFAEVVASTRFRRETQRAGIIPGLKLDSNGSLLAPSSSTSSLRESERNRPREPRGSSLMPHHTGSSTSILRRDASDSALPPSHLYSETSSYRAGSGGYSPGGSTSGHGHHSRPGSMYSSSSEDGWMNIKRHSAMSNSFNRPLPDRMVSYPTWSGSNQSLHSLPSPVFIPQVPSLPVMPELMNDFVLLPPSAPFMMHNGRQSRNSSPGRSTSSGSLRGGSPSSSSERIPSRQSTMRPKEPHTPSPSSSFNHVDSRPTHTRSGSGDSRRSSMPIPLSNRTSTPHSQPSSLSRGDSPDVATSLVREPSGDSLPPSQFSQYFDNDSSFWDEAKGLNIYSEETQINTPPTSLSSGNLRTNSSSTSTSISSASKLTSHESLKRNSSLTSNGPCESPRPAKKPRITVQDSSHLPFINLSPPDGLRNKIEAAKLPFSVHWELARLVSRGKLHWDTSSGGKAIQFSDIDFLKPSEDSTNKQAEGIAKVHESFLSKENGDTQFTIRSRDERTANDPWIEFEKEEAFIAGNPGSELPNPNGGKVHFTAMLRLDKAPGTVKFKIELNPAQLATSCSFTRRFGSKSFFRLKLSKELVCSDSDNGLVDFLTRPIMLCNAIYRAFFGKEQTVFYFKTNERWDANRGGLVAGPPSSGWGLQKFFDWANPIHCNQGQTMAKWAARFALGLSSSIHGITLEEAQIKEIVDIKSDSGSDMTDGAGYISRALLHELARLHDWPNPRPSVLQVRVNGAKGLLVEHPNLDGWEIQLRPSLIKIRYPAPLDPTHRTIDILRTSHARSPTRISTDILINLSENGVNTKVLKEMIQKTFDAQIQPLLQWDLEDLSILRELWVNFERAGSVVKSRRAREEVALARVSGHTEHDTTEEVPEDDEEAQVFDDAAYSSVEWWPDDVSGCPSSLEETIIAFLDAGFRPADCAILREKIVGVVKKTITRTVHNCYVDIPLSASAWIIPDPYKVLEPNELFFKTSQPILTTVDGNKLDILQGDVLITRDPCRLPTDVQKWKAVDKSQLHYLRDVIVLSVKGTRRAADWLAGGDYDGDKAKLIWEPDLVKDFTNADDHFADAPDNLDKHFKTQNEKVDHFLKCVESLPAECRLLEMQKHLLGTMTGQGKVGAYSGFHEYSTLVKGYHHPETKLLAYIFNTVLDGRKTGKTIKEEVYAKHSKELGKRLHWKEFLKPPEDRKYADKSNINPVRRARQPFIMETLVKFLKNLGETKTAAVEDWMRGFPQKLDMRLVEPIHEIDRKIAALSKKNKQETASLLQDDLNLIKTHVRNMYCEHMKAINSSNFKDLQIQKRQDILRILSQKFHSQPQVSEYEVLTKDQSDRLKASYAYQYDFELGRKHSRFPWNVAFRVLSCIKAGNEIKAVHKDFYNFMVIKLPKRHH